MTPVELYDVQGALILRARGSELLILQHFIAELKTLEEPKAFAQFFLHTALVNRPARKLFEAWLRKDRTLWNRIFHKVHKEMEISEEAQQSLKDKATPEVAAEEPKTDKKAPAAKTADAKKDAEPAKKKAAKKKASTKDASEVNKDTTANKKKTAASKKAETTKKKKAASSKKVEATATKKKSTTKQATTAKKKTTANKKPTSSKK